MPFAYSLVLSFLSAHTPGRRISIATAGNAASAAATSDEDYIRPPYWLLSRAWAETFEA